MRMLDAIFNAASRIASTAAGLGIFVLMFLNIADGLKRTIVGRGLPGTVEMTEVFLVVVIFAGMLGAEVTNFHISTSIVTDRLPERARRITRLLGSFISLGAALLFVYACTAPALESFRIREFEYGLVRIPVYPAKIAVLLGFVLLALAMLCGILRQLFTNRRRTDHAVDTPAGPTDVDPARAPLTARQGVSTEPEVPTPTPRADNPPQDALREKVPANES